jgi:inosine/xanthosine triphosphatase
VKRNLIKWRNEKLRIAVGSKNPAKVEAVKLAYGHDVEIITINVDSGVANQPFSDEETIQGATNRAKNCLKETDADFGIGLEGGVVHTNFGLFVCNWGALVTRDGDSFIAGGARILLPEEIAQRVMDGSELGPVMDEYTKKENIRKKEGAIGIFTNEKVTRSEMFQHIMNLLIGQCEYKSGFKK